MKKFLKVLGPTTLSNLFFAFSQWALLVMLTKWGTANDVGTYMYGLALTAPIIMLISLKYENFIHTQELVKQEIQALFTVRILMILSSSFFFIGYIIIAYEEIDFVLVIFSIWAYKSVELIIHFNYSILVNSNDIMYLNKAKVRRSINTLIIAIIIFYFTNNLFFMIAGMTAYLVLDFLIFFKMLKRYNLFSIKVLIANVNKIVLKTYLFSFIPFGLSLFLVSMNANTSRYIGEFFFGTEFVGIFTSISYFIIVGNMVINAVFSITSHNMRLNLQNNFSSFVSAFKRVGSIVTSVGLLGILAAYFLSDRFLVFVYNENYYGLDVEFIIVMLTGFFLYLSTYLQHILAMLGKFNVQFLCVLIGLLSQIVSFIILKDMGEVAVYLSYMFSMVVTFILLLWILIKYYLERKRN